MDGETIAIKLDSEGHRICVAVVGGGARRVGQVRLVLSFLLFLSHPSP